VKTIYVDNNATTAVAPEVVEELRPYLEQDYFNPSSMYEPAQRAAHAIQKARNTIAGALGAADPGEILFTGCATESNNAAIFGALRAHPGRKHVITTKVEHPAVLEVCMELERMGYAVTWLPVDATGRLEVRDLIQALRPETLLVSIMHANNETGVIFPVAELARITKETDSSILFHTDATQTVGKLPVDLSGAMRSVDLLSFSGHKLHAPKGVGALYVRRGIRWRPFMLGGHQESGRRAGTENVPFIVALGRAVELAHQNRAAEHAHMAAMRDRLEMAIHETIPHVQVNGAGAERLPNTLNVAIHYVEGEGMLYQLDAHGICASSGSACTSGSLEPSHVLRAMRVPFTAVHGSLRFSFSRYNTMEEVEEICAVFPGIVANLRKMSPYWDNVNNRPRPEAEEMLKSHISS